MHALFRHEEIERIQPRAQHEKHQSGRQIVGTYVAYIVTILVGDRRQNEHNEGDEHPRHRARNALERIGDARRFVALVRVGREQRQQPLSGDIGQGIGDIPAYRRQGNVGVHHPFARASAYAVEGDIDEDDGGEEGDGQGADAYPGAHFAPFEVAAVNEGADEGIGKTTYQLGGKGDERHHVENVGVYPRVHIAVELGLESVDIAGKKLQTAYTHAVYHGPRRG